MKTIPILLLWFCTISIFADYYIHEGYDFATGERVTEKKSEGKRIWLKRYEGYSPLYKKYDLSYPEPLLTFVSSRGYKFEFFKVVTRNKGWRFWLYDYYILRARLAMCGCGAAPEALFFDILTRFSPPKEEVEVIFEHCIKLKQSNADYRELESYLRKEYDRYEAPGLKKAIDEYLKAPDKFNAEGVFYEYQTRNALRYITEHRDQFPAQFPWQFYRMLTRAVNLPDDTAKFWRAEYRRYPTDLNAYSAAYANIQYDAEKLFEEYHQAGILNRFLQTVMPGKLPPLPRPVPDEQPRRLGRDYGTNDYLNIPRREVFLYWVTDAVDLKSHFRQEFDSLRPRLEEFVMKLPPTPNRPALIFKFTLKKESLDNEFMIHSSERFVLYTVCRIEITTEDFVSEVKTIKNLDAPSLGRPSAIWPATTDPERCFPRNIEVLIEFKDVDFDGNSDLLLHNGCGAQNHVYRIYRYHPTTRSFELDEDFSQKITGSRIDYFPEKKQIECWWHISAVEAPETVYEVKSGKLYLKPHSDSGMANQ